MLNTEFVHLVHQMRTAQKNYFETSRRARNTHRPELFDQAKTYLQESKELERKVDALLEGGVS